MKLYQIVKTGNHIPTVINFTSQEGRDKWFQAFLLVSRSSHSGVIMFNRTSDGHYLQLIVMDEHKEEYTAVDSEIAITL